MHLKLRFLFRKGLFSNNDSFDVGAFTEDLSFIFENQIYKTLRESGVEIYKSTKVNSLIWNGEKFDGVETSKEKFNADTIILATPHHIAYRLLKKNNEITNFICEKMEKMEYNAIIGIHGLYSKKITNDDFHFTALVNEPIIQMVFNRNFELKDDLNSEIEQWLSVPVSYADSYLNYSNQEIQEEYKKVIAKIWPDHSKFLRKIVVIKTPKATFSTKKGSTKLRLKSDEIIPGLRLCGDYIDNNWPSTMESAVISGLMAASNLLDENWNPEDLWKNWPKPPKRGDSNWNTL